MNVGKIIALIGLCLFFLGIVTMTITDSNIKLYSSVSSVSVKKTESDTKSGIDISGLGLGVTDSVDTEILSSLALTLERDEVYDGMTLEELGDKLNRSLKGILSNQGDYIASYCIELGLDPYLVVAIMLHETGCSWSCSTLATTYYNFGGMKGSNGYMKFSSIQAGLKAVMDNLYNNYYSKGKTTPEQINTTYAASTVWASKINSYIAKIKAA